MRRGGNVLTPQSTLKFILRDGDVILRKSELGVIEEIPARLPQRKPFNLEIGDKVFRQLRNDDVVLINRQPSQNM